MCFCWFPSSALHCSTQLFFSHMFCPSWGYHHAVRVSNSGGSDQLPAHWLERWECWPRSHFLLHHGGALAKMTKNSGCLCYRVTLQSEKTQIQKMRVLKDSLEPTACFPKSVWSVYWWIGVGWRLTADGRIVFYNSSASSEYVTWKVAVVRVAVFVAGITIQITFTEQNW